MPAINAYNKETPFIRHCIFGTLTQEIIDENPSLVNVTSIDGYSPLMLTVRLKQPLTLDLLIKNGADVKYNISGKTALWFAASEKNWDAVNVLCVNKACINATPFAEEVQAGKTAVWYAAVYEKWDILLSLIAKGADITVAPIYPKSKQLGKTVLWLAAKAGRVDVVQMLLKKGANAAVIAEADGTTPLLIAAHHNKWDVVELLVNTINFLTAQINMKDKQGESLILIAALNQKWKLVFKLLELGVDINSAAISGPNQGKTILWYAACHQNISIVQKILEKSPLMDVCPMEGMEKYNTPLWEAIYKKNIEMVKLLINKKANINVKNRFGDTMLWHTTVHRETKISMLLLDCEQNDINYAPQDGKNKNITVLWFAAFNQYWDIVLKILLQFPNVDPNILPLEKKYATCSLRQLAKKANQTEVLLALSNIEAKKNNAKKLSTPGAISAAATVVLGKEWQALLTPHLDVKLLKIDRVKLLNGLFAQYYKTDISKDEKMKFSLKNVKECPQHLLGFKKVKDGSFTVDGKKTASLLLQWDSNLPVNVEGALSELVLLSDEYINFIALQETRKKEQECRELKQHIFDFEGKFKNLLTQAETQFISSKNSVTESHQLLANKLEIYKLSITEVITLLQELTLDYKKYSQEEQELAPKSELLVRDYNSLDEIVAEIETIKIELIEKLASRIAYVASFLRESFALDKAKSAINTLCKDFEDVQALKNAADILQAKLNEKLTAWKNTSEDYVKKTEKNKIAIKKFQESIKTNEHHARRLEDIKQEAAQMRLEVERQVQSQNDNLYHNAYKKVTKISNQNAKKEKKIRLQQAPVTKAEDRLSPHMEVLQPAVDNYRPKKRRLTNLNILHDLMQVREKTEVQVNILKEMLSYTPGPERAYIYTRNYSLLVVLASFMESLKQIDTELFAKKLIYDFRNAVYHSSVLNYATDKGQEQFYEELKSLSSKLLAYMDKPGATEYANIATHSLVIKLLDPLKSELSIKEVNSIIHYEVENLELFHESYCCFYKDDTEPTLADRNNFHTIYIKACEYAIARISAGLNWLAYNDITPNRAEYTNQLEKLRAKNSRVKTINNSHKALKVYSKLTGQKINLFLGTNIKQQGNDIRHNNPKRLSPETLPHAESDLSQSVDTTLPISPLNKDNKHSSDIQSPGDSIRILSVTNSSKANTPSPTLCPIKPPPMVTFASFKTCLSEIIVGKVQNIYVNSPSFMIETKSGIRTATLGTSLSYPQVISLTQGIIQSAILNHDDKVNFEINLHLGSYLGELEESAGDEQTKILFSINSYFKSRNIYAYVNLYFESAVCDDSFRPHKLQEILSSSDLPHSKVLASSAPAAIPAKIMLFSAPATAMHTPLSSQLINNPLTPSLDVMPKPVSPQVLQAIKGLQYIFMDGLTNYNERQIQEALDNQLIHIAKHENIVFLICASNSSSSTRVESYNYVINAVNDNYVITSSEYYSTNNDLSQGIMSDEDKIKIHELFSDFWNCEDSIAYNP